MSSQGEKDRKMALCDTCAGLVFTEMVRRKTFIRPNLRSLRDSAAAGCRACQLFWASLQQADDADMIDAISAGNIPGEQLVEEVQPLRDERVWLELSNRYSRVRPWTSPFPYLPSLRDCLEHCRVKVEYRPRGLESRRRKLTGYLEMFADPGMYVFQKSQYVILVFHLSSLADLQLVSDRHRNARRLCL